MSVQSGFDFEAAEHVVVARFTIVGEPVSKSRARFTGFGSKTRAYTPEKTRAAEEVVAWSFHEAARGHVADAEHSFGVVLTFVNGTRQRRDLDNMTKLILDALNKIAWADDNQVVEFSARKLLATKDRARTEVTIYTCGPIQRRAVPCAGCGTLIDMYPSVPAKRFCSLACRTVWASDRKRKTCPSCMERFTDSNNMYCSPACKTAAGRVDLICTECRRTFSRARSWSTNGKPMCSAECRAAYWRQHRAVAAKGVCSFCGGPTSKKSYARCRACVYAGRASS